MLSSPLVEELEQEARSLDKGQLAPLHLVMEMPPWNGKTTAKNCPFNSGESLHLSEQQFPHLCSRDSANFPARPHRTVIRSEST